MRQTLEHYAVIAACTAAQNAPFIINAVKFFAMFYQKLEFKKFRAQRGF